MTRDLIVVWMIIGTMLGLYLLAKLIGYMFAKKTLEVKNLDEINFKWIPPPPPPIRTRYYKGNKRNYLVYKRGL